MASKPNMFEDGPLGPSPWSELRRLRTVNDALATMLGVLTDRCERLQDELEQARRDADWWRREAQAADDEMAEVY